MGATLRDLGGLAAPHPTNIIPMQAPSRYMEPFKDEADLITVQRLHDITGLDERTIRKEITDGDLPGCRIGRRLFIPKGALIDYVTGRGGL